MSDLEVPQLQLVFLPLRNMLRSNAGLYRSAADCWQNVWGGLFETYKVPQPLYLDQLFRQDEAACIFEGGRCAAMILFRIYDFALLDFSRDSYFKEWEAADRALLLAQGPRVFATTYLSVHPDFRHYSANFKFKEILLNIMVKRFVAGDADVISGVTRRDRGIHDESYKLGARVVREEVSYMENRFKVDLVAFYRSEVRESQNPAVRDLTDRLWAEKRDLCTTAPLVEQPLRKAS